MRPLGLQNAPYRAFVSLKSSKLQVVWPCKNLMLSGPSIAKIPLGLMSVENFISCQQNDIAIQNYTGKTQVVAGIICVVRKTTMAEKCRVGAIFSIDVLESFARTLHYSHQNFHSSPRQIVKIIQKDFYILDEKVVYGEIGKCIACLTSE